MNPKFSVIIPVYRAAHTIGRCVESIEKNTFQDLEVILIEDGSPDDSWSVCEKLAAQYPNVKVLRNEKNCGVSHTRNRGLEAARGEYLLFADSDDWVDEHYYEVFNAAIVKHSAQFAVCGYVNHDEKQNGRTDEYRWENAESIRELPLSEELQKLYDGCLLQQLWNKAFLASVIRENHIRFDESISIGEDFRFILAYLEGAKPETVVLINKALYHYMRDQEGSLMFRIGYESVEEPLKNLRRLYQLMGMPKTEIDTQIQVERERQIDLYAYLIMHNMGMRYEEKKRLILLLDEEKGRSLLNKNMWLICKEKIIALKKHMLELLRG